MKRTTMLILAGAALLLLTSCGLLTPEQQSDALAAIDEMLRTGSITKAQYDALREAILTGGTTAWWQSLVQMVGGAALAYIGVQVRRGPAATPEERVARRMAKTRSA